MREIIEQIGKNVENSGLYLADEGNGHEIKDTFYFGVKLTKGKTFSDFLNCFEPIHSKLESEKDLDVYAPVSLIKPSEYAFYNMSLEDAYQNGETVFRPEDTVYSVILKATDSKSKEGDSVDFTFREKNGIILGEIVYDQHILFGKDECDASEKFVRLSSSNVPVQDVWNNVVKKLVAKMDENRLLDNTIDNSVSFTDDISEVLKWEVAMYNKKVDTVDIGKITLDFNNDYMTYSVQATFETPDGKEIYQTQPGELDDFERRDENRDYDVFQNNEFRQMLCLSSNHAHEYHHDELENIKLSEDCQLKVSFTNYFGDNPDVNSVTFPIKDITSENITNDLLSKKFPDVFADDLRMVVDFINVESASYLKPIVERYNLDNPREKVKEDDVTLVQDVSRPKKSNQLKL